MEKAEMMSMNALHACFISNNFNFFLQIRWKKINESLNSQKLLLVDLNKDGKLELLIISEEEEEEEGTYFCLLAIEIPEDFR